MLGGRKDLSLDCCQLKDSYNLKKETGDGR